MIAWSLFHGPLIHPPHPPPVLLCAHGPVQAGQCQKLSLFCHLKLKGVTSHQLCCSGSPRLGPQLRPPVYHLILWAHFLPCPAQQCPVAFALSAPSGVLTLVMSSPGAAQPSAPMESQTRSGCAQPRANSTFGNVHVPSLGPLSPLPPLAVSDLQLSPCRLPPAGSCFPCH